jgi:hypothetical protein
MRICVLLLLSMILPAFVRGDETTVKEWLSIYESQLGPPTKLVFTRDGNEVSMISVKTDAGEIWSRVEVTKPIAMTTLQLGEKLIIWYHDKNMAIDMTEVQKSIRSNVKQMMSAIQNTDTTPTYSISDDLCDGKVCVRITQKYPADQIELLFNSQSSTKVKVKRDQVPHAKVITLEKESGKIVSVKEVDANDKVSSLTQYKTVEPITDWKKEDFSVPEFVKTYFPKNQAEMMDVMRQPLSK